MQKLTITTVTHNSSDEYVAKIKNSFHKQKLLRTKQTKDVELHAIRQ